MQSLKKVPSHFYALCLSFFGLEKKTTIHAIDFQEPWSRIILKQKKYVLIVLAIQLFVHIFYTLIPLSIGWCIQEKQYAPFAAFILIWMGALIAEFFASLYAGIVGSQTTNSAVYNAFIFFLTVDPISHAHRQSGKLFAKVERAARSYDDFLDLVFWDLVPTAIAFITVIVSFLWVDRNLGLLAFLFLIVLSVINIGLNFLFSKSFEQKLISADDAVKASTVESLNQVQLIRNYYASNEIAQRAFKHSTGLMTTESTAWAAFGAINFITQAAYLASIVFLGSYIIHLTKIDSITIPVGIALIITYLNGTYEIIKIGRKLRKILKATVRIQDLYTYIQSYGTQTIPVLTSSLPTAQLVATAQAQPTITLDVLDLQFDYNPRAHIFDRHSLHLSVKKDESNKLFGIIGPSGIGKSTLITILGGQLRPTKGSVVLNNISIYDIDDEARRHLICLQGQVSSTLSGTIRSNLLLGLPEKSPYTDNEMILVLKEVGVWSIFEQKKGLDTIIAEGGITLSGGQRQRINFASLYLRALFYKPLLILIDEPTSSLDEVSEQAITQMILKLAQQSLTLVIAHRLKTLTDAHAIYDFSQIETEKEIQFYPAAELLKKSEYYKRLIENHTTPES